MKRIPHLSIVLVAVLAVAPTKGWSALTLTVYDNLSTLVQAGTSAPNVYSPIFGDALTLLQGGTMSSISLTLYNSLSGGNTGRIMTGTMQVSFYDNTTPYTSGLLSSLPLLGTANLNWDFTGDGGLAPTYYSTNAFDISSYDITVPMNILVTQKFTQTSGTSTRNGVALFENPVVGSSPSTVYIDTSLAEGLYTFSGGNPGQVGYKLEISAIPEPGSVFALGCLVGSGMFLRARRGRS
ncbi:MAG: hypothetical protein NTW21_15515 [Verrucomicrobia bacterium]|nr:hypothetical protein [Verrucomicrobiota bacterium]